MKFTKAIAAFTLITGTFAAPPELDPRQNRQVTFTLTNNMSGANQQRTVPGDGTISMLSRLFSNTRLVNANGRVFASTIECNPPQGLVCTVKDAGGIPVGGVLSERNTFIRLDRSTGRYTETDVSGFTIQCQRP